MSGIDELIEYYTAHINELNKLAVVRMDVNRTLVTRRKYYTEFLDKLKQANENVETTASDICHGVIGSCSEIDIQDETFGWIDTVEPNSTEVSIDSCPGADFRRTNTEETLEFLELYDGDSMVKVNKDDVEKLMCYFNSL